MNSSDRKDDPQGDFREFIGFMRQHVEADKDWKNAVERRTNDLREALEKRTEDLRLALEKRSEDLRVALEKRFEKADERLGVLERGKAAIMAAAAALGIGGGYLGKHL